jgi:predicted helicase
MKHAGGEWSKQHDPIIHFYETFLDKYDPELRRKMGVYYTPLPVVRYMVRAVDDTLKKEFGLQDGLADKSKIVRTTKVHPYGKREQRKGFGEGVEYVHRVQVLDPALGTGTFLNEIIKYIADAKKPQLGTGWSDYVEKDLLPRIHGFEIMMAPYAMSHLRLNLTLAETGYKSTSNQRLGVYLTNTLEKPHVEADELPNLFGFQKILANESQQADEVKTKTPVMVVIGNPPYSGISANMGDFARTLINRYREINGKKVIERGALQLEKNLNDDYVKFIAYAESIIEKNGQGIVAMITNNNYVDAITLRGLRWRLMQTFDSVKVLDLHGSTKKGEKTPDGYKDENVFNIEQGVSIVIAVKGNQINKGIASVAKADAYGTAKHKFELLDRNEFQFDTLKFQDNAYKFIYKDYAKEEEYLQGISVIELFPLYSSGVVTARDKFTIDISYENMWRRIERFSEISVEQARHDFNLGEDSTTWLVSKALKDVTASGPKKELVRKIDYRPFDQRYTYYTGNVVGFYTNPRKPVMQHFLDDKNIGMMVCRQQKTKGFSHVLAHSHIVESSYVSNKTSEIGYSIPLFRIENGEYISNIDEGARKNLLRNVSSNFCDIIDENSDKSQIVPKNIFDYVYGYLHDARYRETYPEFLKEDFPRVPKPKAADEFWRYVAYGSKLRKLHLMEPGSVPAQFFPPQGDGDMTIEKVSFVETHDGIGNVYFNGTDYFENIPRIAYDFTIGAYRPAYHWLNSRKGRMLTNEDVEYYQKIINVLLETFRVMKEIG